MKNNCQHNWCPSDESVNSWQHLVEKLFCLSCTIFGVKRLVHIWRRLFCTTEICTLFVNALFSLMAIFLAHPCLRSDKSQNTVADHCKGCRNYKRKKKRPSVFHFILYTITVLSQVLFFKKIKEVTDTQNLNWIGIFLQRIDNLLKIACSLVSNWFKPRTLCLAVTEQIGLWTFFESICERMYTEDSKEFELHLTARLFSSIILQLNIFYFLVVVKLL